MAEPQITTPQTPQEAKTKSKGKNKFKPGEVGYIKSPTLEWEPVENIVPPSDDTPVANISTCRFWVFDTAWCTLQDKRNRLVMVFYSSQTGSKIVRYEELDTKTLRPFFKQYGTNKNPDKRKDKLREVVCGLWQDVPEMAAHLSLENFRTSYPAFKPPFAVHTLTSTTTRKKLATGHNESSAPDESVVSVGTKRPTDNPEPTPSKKSRALAKSATAIATNLESGAITDSADDAAASPDPLCRYFLSTLSSADPKETVLREAAATAIESKYRSKPPDDVLTRTKQEMHEDLLKNMSNISIITTISHSFARWVLSTPSKEDMADPRMEAAMANGQTEGTMADQNTEEALRDQNTEEAITEQNKEEGMADGETEGAQVVGEFPWHVPVRQPASSPNVKTIWDSKLQNVLDDRRKHEAT